MKMSSQNEDTEGDQKVSGKDGGEAEVSADSMADASKRMTMVALSMSVLGAKPVCRLRAKECRRLSEQIVEAFWDSYGRSEPDQVCFSGLAAVLSNPSWQFFSSIAHHAVAIGHAAE